MTTPKTKTPGAPKAKADAKPNTITLVDVCEEMSIKPREARMLLRLAVSRKDQYPALAAAHVTRRPWQWVAGSDALSEAKKALKAEQEANA